MYDEYTYTPHIKWTEEEIIFIEENLKTLGVTKIAKRLGRSRGSVNSKIQHMKKIQQMDNSYATKSLEHANWSTSEVEQLKRLLCHTDFDFGEIGIKLSRTRSSIKTKVYSLYGTCSREKVRTMDIRCDI
jgi:IS30 family transposase